MVRFEITLPVVNNDGTHNGERIVGITLAIAAITGGYTRQNVVGGWLDNNDQLVTDHNVLVFTYATEVQAQQLAELVPAWRQTLGQDALVYSTVKASVNFV